MRTILTIIYLGFLFLISFILIIVDKIKPFTDMQAYKMINAVARHLDMLSGNQYTIVGEQNIPDQPVLIVSNHLSFFDPITIVDIFKDHPVALVGKIELTKIPTLEYWTAKFGCNYIDRDNIRQQIIVIKNVTNEMKKGRHALIFPEGTRSIEDCEFKAGSFKIAQKSKSAILPITCRNTADVFENNKGIRLRKAHPVITIHPLIPYEDYKDKDLQTVAAEVQAIVSSV